jgi:hypothetical protein
MRWSPGKGRQRGDVRERAAGSIAVVSRSRARDDQPALVGRPAHPHPQWEPLDTGDRTPSARPATALRLVAHHLQPLLSLAAQQHLAAHPGCAAAASGSPQGALAPHLAALTLVTGVELLAL